MEPERVVAPVIAAPVTRLSIDGHVHVHPSYDQEVFLSAAWDNLHRHGDGVPVLFLAEMSGVDVFSTWRSGLAPWAATLTDEAESLWLDGRLLVIAGRQIVTAEGIEVLALLTKNQFPDGEALESTLARVNESGAIAVVPWGVGKWLGRRGRVVAELAGRHRLLLGDNAGRPIGWRAPALFGTHRVLPGTDPLRLKSDEQRVGSYGFVLECTFDSQRPAASIRKALQELDGSPPSLGRRVGPAEFLRLQLGLRLAR